MLGLKIVWRDVLMRKQLFGMFALLLAGLVVAAGTTSAFGFGFARGEDQDAIDAAIDAGDFGAWKSAVTDSLTEENFQWEVEHRNARGQGKGPVDSQAQDAVRAAVVAGDYDAYVAAVEELVFNPHPVLTEEDFDLLVQLHEARLAGDDQVADALAEELGWEEPLMGRGHGMGQGRGAGMGADRGCLQEE